MVSNYRSLFDNAVIGILETSRDGKILAANPGFASMVGYESPEELMAEAPDIRALYNDPADREVLLSLIQERGEANDFGLSLRRRDGSLLWVSASVRGVRDESGELVGLEGFVIDITSRKETEAALNLEREKLAEAQALTHVGSWEWDVLAGTVTWSNELYRIYGLAPEEFEGSYEGFLDRVHPDDRAFVKGVVDRSYEERAPFDFYHRTVRSDRTVRTLHARGRTILDEEGKLIRMVGTGQDVTEQHEIQESLRRSLDELHAVDADRRRLLDKLSDVYEQERVRIARELHDGLGQALASISLFAKELEEDAPTPYSQRLSELRKIAEDAIVSVRSMVWNLSPVELDQLGLPAAIRRLAQEIRAQFGMTVNLRVWGKQARLNERSEIAAYRILQESMTNALRHSKAQCINVELGFEEETFLASVDDEGIGFEFSEAVQSTGHFGLMNMDERARAVGGEVTVDSRPGLGTSIRVRLPVDGVPN